MKTKTLYYDAFLAGLVPVKPLAALEGGRFRVRVSRDAKGYRKGEELECYGRSLVNKVGHTSGGHILVCTANMREHFPSGSI